VGPKFLRVRKFCFPPHVPAKFFERAKIWQKKQKWFHIRSHHIASLHITSHHITHHTTSLTPHHITSHHITSHHITPDHITSHHITPSHHITSHQTHPASRYRSKEILRGLYGFIESKEILRGLYGFIENLVAFIFSVHAMINRLEIYFWISCSIGKIYTHHIIELRPLNKIPVDHITRQANSLREKILIKSKSLRWFSYFPKTDSNSLLYSHSHSHHKHPPLTAFLVSFLVVNSKTCNSLSSKKISAKKFTPKIHLNFGDICEMLKKLKVLLRTCNIYEKCLNRKTKMHHSGCGTIKIVASCCSRWIHFSLVSRVLVVRKNACETFWKSNLLWKVWVFLPILSFSTDFVRLAAKNFRDSLLKSTENWSLSIDFVCRTAKNLRISRWNHRGKVVKNFQLSVTNFYLRIFQRNYAGV